MSVLCKESSGQSKETGSLLHPKDDSKVTDRAGSRRRSLSASISSMRRIGKAAAPWNWLEKGASCDAHLNLSSPSEDHDEGGTNDDNENDDDDTLLIPTKKPAKQQRVFQRHSSK